MYSKRRAAERMEAIGLALDCPAMSGADPWTGSPCDEDLRRVEDFRRNGKRRAKLG